jgi:glycosyltransferase involved in cell wall biosynthesis
MLSSVAMGGGERVVVSLIPYLNQAGVTAELGTLNTRRDSPLADDFARTGIPRHDMGARRMVDFNAWRRFTEVLRDEKIDLIHSHDQDTNIYGALANRLLGMPVVMTRHVMVEPSDTLKETVRARLLLWAARYGSDRVVAVSEAVRKKFAEQTGLPLSRIETIYNGIAVEKFATRPKRAAKRVEMGWEPDRPIVIMVAVLRRGKGHEVLLEAIPQVKAAIANVQIKLVGDGELNEVLRKQVQPYGDVVEFLGQRTDVPELLGASDVLVLPSWTEALPTVLIEAGAASLPVVATDVGGTAEIVVNGETGYVIPPGSVTEIASKLIDVLQNTDRARIMGERAQVRVAQMFSYEQQARQTVALYERVLQEKRKR